MIMVLTVLVIVCLIATLISSEYSKMVKRKRAKAPAGSNLTRGSAFNGARTRDNRDIWTWRSNKESDSEDVELGVTSPSVDAQ